MPAHRRYVIFLVLVLTIFHIGRYVGAFPVKKSIRIVFREFPQPGESSNFNWSKDPPLVNKVGLRKKRDDIEGKGHISPYVNIHSRIDNEDRPSKCPREMFFHEKGSQCVPALCYGGNIWRDRETGDCTLGTYNSHWNFKLSQIYPLRRVYWDYYQGQ